MTEINEALSRHPVDPVAFVFALIGAPLFVAILGFWALFIPVVAIYFGAIPYLAFGAPLFFLSLQKHGIDIDRLIIIGVYANGLIPLFFIPVAVTKGLSLQEYLSFSYFLVGFGVLIGPLWAWAFGYLYKILQRDFYANPL